MKNLTGGDAITCRRMREDEWTFAPTHTAFMHTNYKPRISGTDLGIWRRIRLIPWTVTISDDEKDPELGDKLDARGRRHPQLAGRRLPRLADLRARRTRHRGRRHRGVPGRRGPRRPVHRRLPRRDPAGSIRSKRLRELYEDWCDDAGEEEWGTQRFGRALTDRGFDSAKVGPDAYRLGLEEP